MPRSKIRVVKDCQSWQNLNVFFESTKWMDTLTTPMTTSARTFVVQKNSNFNISEKYGLKMRIELKTNIPGDPK